MKNSADGSSTAKTMPGPGPRPPRFQKPASSSPQPKPGLLGRLFRAGRRFTQQWSDAGHFGLSVTTGTPPTEGCRALVGLFDVTAAQYAEEFESLAEIDPNRERELVEDENDISTGMAKSTSASEA